MTAENNDDWLSNPAPAHKAARPKAAPKPKAAAKPATVTPLRPLAALAAALDDPPIAASPGAAPGAGLDPPDPKPAPPPPPPAGSKPARPRGKIWDRCPVTPLGVYGDLSWYLDVRGQLRGVDNHTLQKMLHIFGGRSLLLSKHFPQYDKDGVARRGKFDQSTLSAAMIAACDECGVWSPTGRVRGSGAWADDDGGLVFHAGDAVLVGTEWLEPGVYGGRVYPASDPVPRPAETATGDPAAKLLTTLATWTWRRPDTDPMLMLGMICAQYMGGALEWRPVGWITGDAATGKSTLQKLMLYLHGGEAGLLQAADATEAGIRSVVGYSSLPVAIDELEPDVDRPQKVKAVVELARRAASGGQIFRGGADQKGHQSNACSSFVFSSILVPDMPAQDRSRLILLDLDRLPPDAPKISLNPRDTRAQGAALRRRLIDGWATWAARLDLWREALARHGQTGRGADNYATVLAMADMALHSDLPTAEVADNWAKKLDRAVTDDSVEVGSNAEDMMVHLLSQPLDIWRRGQRLPVATWVAFAAELPGAPESIEGKDPRDANDLLAPYGLRIRHKGHDAELFIANAKLAGLCELFDRSPWASGVWAQAVRRLPGVEAANLRINRVPTRGHYVPLKCIPGFLGIPMDKPATPPPPPYGPDDMEAFA